MNKAQRVVLILSCLLLVYCCVWIPWHVRLRYPSGAYERVGYGWVWAGAYRSTPIVYNPPIKSSNGLEILGEVDLRSSWVDLNAEPDLRLMILRFVATTALAGFVFLVAGLWKSATRSL